MASTPVAVVRGAAVAVLVCALSACHISFGGGSGKPVAGPPPSQPPSAQPSSQPSVNPAEQYPGQVSLHFASDPGASTKTVDCASGVDFDVLVGTDGRPVSWKAASSDNANNFIGNPVGGIDVAPATGTLAGGQTATVHVSGAVTSIIDSFWIGVTDVRGSGATLEVDCAH